LIDRTKARCPSSPGCTAGANCSGGLIEEVQKDSVAEELGLRAGDRVVSINGHRLRDVLDYQFHVCDDEIDVEVERDGETFELSLEGADSLGIRFADATFDGVRTCRNRCVFCFLRGLPNGMRPGLYVRDDDYRLSASVGNFVTLTNLDDEDWTRLEEQRLSPLYVSVHATDPDCRRRLLGKRDAPEIVPQLERLASLGIQVHAQVVLCPGMNDGAQLDRTLSDLTSLHPAVQSIGVVPVGLTRYHEAEGALRRFTSAEAAAVVKQVRRWQRESRQQLGIAVVYASDEFHLLAGVRFPSARAYDGFPQLANGIGMVRLLLDEWGRIRRNLRSKREQQDSSGGQKARTATIACGALIAPIMRGIAEELAVLTDVSVEVISVSNQFFGPEVTVSGLLTGDDFLKALQSRSLGGVVVLPRTALDSEGRWFLDNVTPVELEARLGVHFAFADDVRGLLAALEAA
jgi:putative radical SAM enzyme (TIGR03279 family)